MASNAVIETIQFINRSGSPRLFASWDALGDRNLDKIKPLFAAVATAIGGRNGHTEAQDHSVSAVKLQVTDESLPQAELKAVTREAQEKNLSVLASDAEKRAGGS
jgi:hypothetical protein